MEGLIFLPFNSTISIVI
jgi:RNA recognition motif-containing protein